jgi:hypothetical protein
MPWNPQRVVQRNGRVIRLLSPHDEVYLTTMLPERGELEEVLRLETLVRGKIRAAGVYGMEVEVVEGIETDLRAYAERLEAGKLDELEPEEDEALSGAFLGEQLRALVARARGKKASSSGSLRSRGGSAPSSARRPQRSREEHPASSSRRERAPTDTGTGGTSSSATRRRCPIPTC